MNQTLLQAAALIIPLIIAIVFHEVAHGWTALALGDPTAQEQRRLSLNPLRHVDPMGTIALPGFLALTGLPIFGWAKPVPVNRWRLNDPRRGMMVVAAAGPGTNLVLAAVGALLLGLLVRFAGNAEGAGLTFAAMNLNNFITINVFLALFNLLPIPPFDGSHIVEGLLPRAAAAQYERFRPYGFPLLIVLLLVVPYFFPQWGVVRRLVLPPVIWATDHYYALAQFVAGA
ncbi:Zn-dependent protease [Novosphingobium sp. PhB57]|jgi:Zn-dependent protease|uniref:site-2 protease family protein n=1 Tax=unclassified Novosphingobium TaxID=2644732 RepID=UPI001043FBB5|nr:MULTISPECIES: site-2 protease family protein [unclassified Novosphingobium]TCU59864.1 Zn-dependent protease [Novosphingobium sp. PhB57]TDW62665.1 Zn-dependent protease [Novosphingobium sp. PhB55]